MENKRKISAKIVADSIDPRGNRITTFILTYPRMIHAELLTHRLFSRNAASSRAIPFKKMYSDVAEDPFVPIAWQKDHKGMQGMEYETDEEEISILKQEWVYARDKALDSASYLHSRGLTKQLCNRLLEPFQWYTCLVTATEFDNFYELRCPKIYHAASGEYYKSVKDWNKIDSEIQYNGLSCLHPENTSQAEIHIQALAEAMWNAQSESTPKELKSGEWHIPFGDKIKNEESYSLEGMISENKIKIATARCARLSYMTFDGEIDYEKDIKLHDQLIGPPFHASPFEHCCRVMSDGELLMYRKVDPFTNDSDNLGWCNNIKGFIQYRYLLENE